MSFNQNQQMVFLVLQYLAEENLTESVHRLERDSGLYFNMRYFELKVLSGNWTEVETYLSGFTKLGDNRYSTKMYFTIQKQKYLEALDRQDKHSAVEILVNKLKVFEELNPELYKEMTELITLSNFRENQTLSGYGDIRAIRSIMMSELKWLIEANPIFQNKLTFPLMKTGRLRTLMNQSLTWQHQRCKTPMRNPDIRTLLTDHTCPPPNSSPDLPATLQINEPTQCVIVTMPDNNINVTMPYNYINDFDVKIGKLMYTHNGDGVIALTASGNLKFWKWARNTTMGNVSPLLWQPESSIPMTNDALVGAVPCLAIAKNDAYLLSASGGSITLYNLMTFNGMMIYKIPPAPSSSFVAFHPLDNNIVALGMEDSNIHIYYVRLQEVENQLKGHEKHITGITFSCILNLMVSSGADAQVIFWSLDKWVKKNSIFLEVPGNNRKYLRSGNTDVQFHPNQICILVSHQTQLAIYDCIKMTRMLQWVPQGDLSSPISLATYSCDGQMIYATFWDASIGIFESNNLRIMCRITPNVYIPAHLSLFDGNIGSNEATQVYSIGALASHPHYPNQFAVGLTNGSVQVIEPKPAGRNWEDPYPNEGGADNLPNGGETDNLANDEGETDNLPNNDVPPINIQ